MVVPVLVAVVIVVVRLAVAVTVAFNSTYQPPFHSLAGWRACVAHGRLAGWLGVATRAPEAQRRSRGLWFMSPTFRNQSGAAHLSEALNHRESITLKSVCIERRAANAHSHKQELFRGNQVQL